MRNMSQVYVYTVASRHTRRLSLTRPGPVAPCCCFSYEVVQYFSPRLSGYPSPGSPSSSLCPSAPRGPWFTYESLGHFMVSPPLHADPLSLARLFSALSNPSNPSSPSLRLTAHTLHPSHHHPKTQTSPSCPLLPVPGLRAVYYRGGS